MTLVAWCSMVLAACGAAAQQRTAGFASKQPTIEGHTLEGASVDLSSKLGHPVVLVFWAAWCGPCHDEQPRLDAAYAKWAPRGVDFMGVDMRDDSGAAMAFQSQLKVPYRSVADPDATVSASFDIPAAPALVFVDRRGRIADRILGGLAGMSGADFDAEVNALLGAGGSGSASPTAG